MYDGSPRELPQADQMRPLVPAFALVVAVVPGTGNREPASVTVDEVNDKGGLHRRSRLGEGGRRPLLGESPPDAASW